ncbi:hypothetical protein 20Sep418_00176 [Pseudomonas phage 20Sep418]|uniref:Uncharacterized protein n=4 Tax=Viruses TaxID=10239 RepID=A0AAF0JIH6_9CAUD|nr:hypothetical protein QE325_gp029 [Pseudomonas phage pPA-3099-2aT.2]YP_010763703.1 hypothetical protein QE331_gp133 [Pseudomonas phage 20Sep416]WFG37141.1 hypothetical protein 9081_00026 [Pseudomonas phage bmx-p3]WFG37851.1 hypothetical protein 20Sep418_00176 [Pseudomonas phage 20Sep418]WBQ35120.1 hypothetical protein [Pseudomonas phage pPA-3099-2aT.2]WFG37674.1 hypothetical protein 20Sep416_00194 [Pseudomonas phage 20Sep416]
MQRLSKPRREPEGSRVGSSDPKRTGRESVMI